MNKVSLLLIFVIYFKLKNKRRAINTKKFDSWYHLRKYRMGLLK